MADSLFPETRTDAAMRRALRRSRLFATALLAFAALVFLGTAALPAPGFWWSLLHAGSEAAVVGGLADWFAVTALFRRPLGLPIPRTAIIPRSKDRIGAGLGHFVERNFLTPEILAAKLAQFAPAQRLAEWLGAPERARLIAERLSEALPPIVRSLEDPALRDFVARSFAEQLREAELAPVLGRLLALLTRSGPFDALFDRALDGAQDLLARNADRLYLAVAERSRWWIPRTIDRRIAGQIVDGISEILAELRQPESDARRRFRAAIEDAAHDLAVSPEWRQRVAELTHRVLDQPEAQQWLAAMWDDLRHIVLDDLAAPTSRTREAMAAALLSLGRTLAADAAMQRRLEDGIEHLALAVVPWRGQIAALIAEVVRGWDAGTVTDRLELVLGSDLQYIRINGTLVGACVGCVLFLIARFGIAP
jgi:uncharacterized membrane-anchored protein YjiN (DUF445 family)